jgi:trehalose 6-phosphate synthase/phosphatase
LRSEVEELVGRVNGKLGKIGWVPIWFFCQTFHFEELVALYRVSDVLLVTPLRDGMNLVVKEYIASRADYRGTVVLSETAGASNELGDAIQVNPCNMEGIAAALRQALEMPIVEQFERNRNMHERIARYTVEDWATDFVCKLDEQHERQVHYREAVLLKGAGIQKLVSKYCEAKRRLIILDYDGTLAKLEKHPEDAAPGKDVKALLERCVADPDNTVLIASGRKRKELNDWFADISIDLSAEHGLWIRRAGEEWRSELVLRDDWKKDIVPILDSFVNRTPGSFVEEKTAGLAWHYRNCEPEQAHVRLNDLRETLISYTQNLGLSLLDGKKVLEIRDAHANKGSLIEQWIHRERWDLIICAGDDVTDEDMFAVLPREAYSLKVGRGQSAARFHVESHADIKSLLADCCEAAGK